MSEEEIEAIKMCRLLLNGDITLHIIDDDGGTAYAGTVNKTYNDDLETVLNLIKKQQAEIEDLKKSVDYTYEAYQDAGKKMFDYAEEIEKKDKEIENWKVEYNHWCQLAIDRKKELKKKDKMIDLMAIAIGNEPLPTEEYCIFRNFDCPAVGGNRDCKECVKQYFERKVENEN